MLIYRGYDIKGSPEDGYTWTDERGFDHFGVQVTRTPYKTEDEAQDAIDAYKRNMRKGG